MRYACCHWRDHVRGVHFQSNKRFADLVFGLFTSKSESQAGLLIFNDENPAWELNSEWIASCTSGPESLFHNACCLSLDHTGQRLLESGKSVHMQSRDLGSTLLPIVWKEHESIVDGLLKPGAGVNISSGYSGTALQIAASKGPRKYCK